ncbi:unnamed protein product [Bursaphelenchus xylophilus]|uniref:(pine wood nematode) hypothetical protein n=1 Tax=Bursaphelenchus xylophilus TaxID=6326 RepID=A0A1I7RP87_BURXY|nr:unnamed protein product [Bursaphelenchus xylophilus]CAG9095591.1 unnamed protein product [Bursaphelenchus xylophilus]
MVEIISAITNALGYRLHILVDTNESLNYSRMHEILQAGKIDTVGVPFQDTEDRRKTVDLTHSLYTVDSYILIRASGGIDENWWSIFRIYDTYSWCLIGLLFFLQCVFAYVVAKAEAKAGLQTKHGLCSIVWQVVRIQFFQSGQVNFRFSSGRFSLFLFALLQGTVIVGMFTSWFLSSLIRTPSYSNLKLSSYVFAEIASGRRRLVTEGSENWFRDQTSSVGTSFQKLQDALRGRKLVAGLSHKEALKMVRDEGALMYTQKDWVGYVHAIRHCEIVKTHVAFPPVGTHLLFPKNSTLLPKINQIIAKNSLRFQNIYKRYTSLTSTAACNKFRPGQPLRTAFFNGLIIVCGALFLIAGTILLLEILLAKNNRYCFI